MAAIARVHVDVWRSTYRDLLPTSFLDSLSYAQREDLWRGVVAHPAGRHVLVARESDGPVIGFALAGVLPAPLAGFSAELNAIYVLDSHQRKGVGTGLLRAVAGSLVDDGADSMFTWVIEGNPAVRFYDRLGGRRFDERSVEIAGRTVGEIGYGWDRLVDQLVHHDRR